MAMLIVLIMLRVLQARHCQGGRHPAAGGAAGAGRGRGRAAGGGPRAQQPVLQQRVQPGGEQISLLSSLFSLLSSLLFIFFYR